MLPLALSRLDGAAAPPAPGHQGARSGEPAPPPEDGGPAPGRPIHRLSDALRRRHGCKLRRMMLDLGLSCPNRDGATGYGGCVYCDVHGSGTGAAAAGRDLERQYADELRRVRRSIPSGPCGILYFQSYSNTWPDLEPLRRALDWAAGKAGEAPVLAIGTRPDCFSEAAADLIARRRAEFAEVWVEFGLETADDALQARIGRHDSLAGFHAACRLAGERGLGRVAHAMAGLPGQAPDDLRRQAEEIGRAGCEGAKFHQLIPLRRTILAKQWLNGAFELPDARAYGAMLAEALLALPWRVVVHRLCADAPPEERLDGRDRAWNREAERHALDALRGAW